MCMMSSAGQSSPALLHLFTLLRPPYNVHALSSRSDRQSSVLVGRVGMLHVGVHILQTVVYAATPTGGGGKCYEWDEFDQF